MTQTDHLQASLLTWIGDSITPLERIELSDRIDAIRRNCAMQTLEDLCRSVCRLCSPVVMTTSGGHMVSGLPKKKEIFGIHVWVHEGIGKDPGAWCDAYKIRDWMAGLKK